MPILKKPIGTPDAPQQLNQKSRKGKKAWRKNVDVSEIQSGLAAVQDEVRQGYVGRASWRGDLANAVQRCYH